MATTLYPPLRGTSHIINAINVYIAINFEHMAVKRLVLKKISIHYKDFPTVERKCRGRGGGRSLYPVFSVLFGLVAGLAFPGWVLLRLRSPPRSPEQEKARVSVPTGAKAGPAGVTASASQGAYKNQRRRVSKLPEQRLRPRRSGS